MRQSGILLPIFSLPSPYGIGTLGKAAYNWIDFLAGAKQSIWQVLPVGPTSYGDSPYQSFSAFAGNPYFIDLDILREEGLLTADELAALPCPDVGIDYALLYETRFEILRKAYSRFSDSSALDSFISKNEWLHGFALFMALKNKFGGAAWSEWDEDIRLRKPSAVRAAEAELSESILFECFIQYEFFKQWNALHEYARSKGIKLMGDLPIYVALDSADVWASPELFQLNDDLTPSFVAGCPPDAFSEDGQLWGNPLYRWEDMKEDGYSWWLCRLRAAFGLFDAVRIDHFRGFEKYYSIPYGETTARCGRWRLGPGIDFISAVKNAFPHADIVAEDLGFLTDEVRKLLRDSGFPGMKVLQFAFDGDMNNCYLPEHHIKNSVAYTGTHDNDTVGGWLAEGGVQQKNAAKHLGFAPDDIAAGIEAFISAVMNSAADTAIIPAQDWLGLGSAARTNEPSTLGKNWQWRLNNGIINAELSAKIRRLTLESKRGCAEK